MLKLFPWRKKRKNETFCCAQKHFFGWGSLEYLKVIAIVTTSGTGSEVTCAAVITNKDVKPEVKQVIVSHEITPDVAIVDPEMSSSMPPGVTSATGMDALTHAIESYTSIAATDIDKAIDLGAIKIIFRALPKAFADGTNAAAREDMHTASLMAGMAFTNSFLGITHALAHQLGTEYGLPHGKALQDLKDLYIAAFYGNEVM